MDYILKPSLKHISLVKVATTLWNEVDIKHLMAKYCKPFNEMTLKDKWPEIEKRVKLKVIQLQLPECLMEETSAFIKPIGSQILRWIKLQARALSNIDLPQEFQWTPKGTIDDKKTAEMLVQNATIDVAVRYKMACIYCLEEDVKNLWNEIPENRKKAFYNEEDPMYVMQEDLVVVWTYDIKGEMDRLWHMMERWHSPYQYAFEYAARHANIAAMEYFLPKLTGRSRIKALERATRSAGYSRIDVDNNHTKFLPEYYSLSMCFLLSHMDKDEQIETFKIFHYKVLICLLDFPLQTFFKETASVMWDFLPKEFYHVVLLTMIKKSKLGFKDFDYQKALGENWQQSPDAYKRAFFDEHTNGYNGYLIMELFRMKDKNNIKLLLQDATPQEKKNLLNSLSVKDICEDLVENEEWCLLRFFLQECVSSKDEMVKLNRDFLKYVTQAPKNKEIKDKVVIKDRFKKNALKWKKFFHLLHDFTCMCNKRKYTEEDNSKKRSCKKLKE